MIENAYSVGASPYTCDNFIGQFSFCFVELLSGFPANDALNIAYHHRVRMRSGNSAYDIEGISCMCNPVANGVIHGILEGARSALYSMNLCSEQFHSEDVGLLTGNVNCSHIDHGLQSQQSAGGSGSHTVLSGAGFGHNALFAHFARQQRLPQRVVDFMRAGVVQVFTLEINFCAAQMFGEPPGVGQWRLAAHVGFQEVIQFGLKSGVALRLRVGVFQFQQGRH